MIRLAGRGDTSSSSESRLVNKTRVSRLRQLVTGATTNVPFYRERYAQIEFSTDAESLLAQLPIIAKTDLLEQPLKARLDSNYDASRLTQESTTGSTGQPFTLYVDDAYKRRRNVRFLRALLAAGYRPWHRVMLLTDRFPDSIHRVGRRYYVSAEQPTSAIADLFEQIRPHVLYGLTTPLRLLADTDSVNARSSQPQSVISSGEVLDTPLADWFRRQFGAAVYDFYGMTETGLVAWRNCDAEVYSVFDRSVLVELIRHASIDGLYHVVITNLDLQCMPIIRLDSGDLASARFVDGRLRITAFDGRRIDTLIRIDGSEISPYTMTDALRDVVGLRRFRVVQHSTELCRIDAVVDPEEQPRATERMRSIVRSILGAGVQTDVRFRNRLIEDGSRKFRPVESRVRRDVS